MRRSINRSLLIVSATSLCLLAPALSTASPVVILNPDGSVTHTQPPVEPTQDSSAQESQRKPSCKRASKAATRACKRQRRTAQAKPQR